MKKILVIAPHADDEVLGCGGYLIHEARKGSEIHLAIGTLGGLHPRQFFETREKEFYSVIAALKGHGASDVVGRWLYKNEDAMLDEMPSSEITTWLDKIIDDVKPDEVFLNYKSRHQDHIKIYDCAMASLRLREGYMPRLIALYEYSFVADGLQMPLGGSMYHDITDDIDDKIALFSLYESQIRKSPSPLNEHGVRTLAAFRGMECGVGYAEKFYVQKIIL